MSNHENGAELEKMAKEHEMSVDEFTKKSGLKFNEDGSHSLDGHTQDMFSKDYTEAELKDLANHLCDQKLLNSDEIKKLVLKITNNVDIKFPIHFTQF